VLDVRTQDVRQAAPITPIEPCGEWYHRTSHPQPKSSGRPKQKWTHRKLTTIFGFLIPRNVLSPNFQSRRTRDSSQVSTARHREMIVSQDRVRADTETSKFVVPMRQLVRTIRPPQRGSRDGFPRDLERNGSCVVGKKYGSSAGLWPEAAPSAQNVSSWCRGLWAKLPSVT
jgi:hypothetical protein